MTSYIGRFAPSPTGPLHLGSLVTALASWADARHHRGDWLLRIEDIDPPREVDGATPAIIEALQHHGLNWDGDITYQHAQSHRYDAALATLREAKRLYACQCTRKQLRAQAQATGSSAYPGHCAGLNLVETNRPLRLRVRDELVEYHDLHAGTQQENVAESVGDFIIRRKDNLYAYQLAVVTDDAHQHITHIVRGSDLLDNTARQIALQRALKYRRPTYLHLPLVLTDDGAKLSKQTGAPALENNCALDNLRAAWRYLGQKTLTARTVSEFLSAAVAAWNRAQIPETDTRMYQI
jgi:glutamyl-Q tRNA(Asp) synthetase